MFKMIFAVQFLQVLSSIFAAAHAMPAVIPDSPEVVVSEGKLPRDLRIFAVSDMDTSARTESGKWVAFIKEGTLHFDPIKQNASITWQDQDYIITSGFSYKERGMELSTLNQFNGKLYSCDDKTGIVFELRNTTGNKFDPIPWVILAGAKGTKSVHTGFKCEWATVKDGNLWIGGHGNYKDKLIRIVSPEGQVKTVDWTENYGKMANALGVEPPFGYVTNEAGAWSESMGKWIFLPRKISQEPFNAIDDESNGSNLVLITDEDFEDIEIREIGNLEPTHGFSSIKFLPETGDQILVALKTTEVGDTTSSYVLVSDLENHTLLEETKFDDNKYEGVELMRKRRK